MAKTRNTRFHWPWPRANRRRRFCAITRRQCWQGWSSATRAGCCCTALCSSGAFSDALLTAVLKRSKFKGIRGEMVAGHTKAFREAWSHVRSNREPQVQMLDSPNTFVNLGEDFVLKLYRKVEAGTNPDREVEEFLTRANKFRAHAKGAGLDGILHPSKMMKNSVRRWDW